MKFPRSAWRGKRVAILGAGKSGQSAARLLAHLGAEVLLSDAGQPVPLPHLSPSIQLETGGHSDRVLKAQLIIRSPGISDQLPLLKSARKKKIPVWGEIELACRLVRPKDLVAITGTNGKTTTTTLVGELFKAHQPKTFVAGNIGTPLADLALNVDDQSTVVVEVSSYQLENVETFHPTISAILNITPDHLEHHGTMRAYAGAKARVFENQRGRDVCVLNADDLWCRRLAKKVRCKTLFFSRQKALRQGVYFDHGQIVVMEGTRVYRFNLEWRLPGAHNIENALASVAIARAAGIPIEKIQTVLNQFKGVEHRIEHVRTLRDVRYVNDSKATNIDSTRVALDSFRDPLILIMGGRGKGSPYTTLEGLIKKQVRYLLLIGEDAPHIQREIGHLVPVDLVETMPAAVQRASELAQPGDVVLLSPACASFDQYANYEERGRHFKALVHELK